MKKLFHILLFSTFSLFSFSQDECEIYSEVLKYFNDIQKKQIFFDTNAIYDPSNKSTKIPGNYQLDFYIVQPKMDLKDKHFKYFVDRINERSKKRIFKTDTINKSINCSFNNFKSQYVQSEIIMFDYNWFDSIDNNSNEIVHYEKAVLKLSNVLFEDKKAYVVVATRFGPRPHSHGGNFSTFYLKKRGKKWKVKKRF